MAEDRMETSYTFKLLDLPDAALSIIIADLTDSNEKAIMAACRKSFDMAMLNAGITLKVAQGSKFAAFKKVLDSTFPASIHLVIICPAGNPKDLKSLYQEPLSTVAVLMGMVPDSILTELAASCQGNAWERITKVTIKGSMMRCLAPRFIALACPHLVHLRVMSPSDAPYDTPIFSTEPGDALPLTLSSGLKQLEFDSFRPRLPASYHTKTELLQNLPNIDTLVCKNSCDPSLIAAFAKQLTRLEVHNYSSYEDNEDDEDVEDDEDPIRPSVRMCSNLQHLAVPELVLPDSTANLRVLQLSRDFTDDDMQMLLHLPRLTVLRLDSLHNIKQDWSGHACPWQELHFGFLYFAKLANLNLTSLKKLSVGPDTVVCLPDPSPNSLSAVQRAADNLSHVGQIVVNQNKTKAGVCFGQSGTVCWDISGSSRNHEQTAAELIRVATQRIGPCRVCNCHNLIDRPVLLEAVFHWGRMFIESICLGPNHEPQPRVWQALQQLDRLNTVVFWGFFQQWDKPQDELLKVSNAVYAAAQQYVIPANRSLRIECGFSVSSLEPAEMTENKTFLHAAIHDVLPAGCKLASVEFCSMEDNDHYTGYRHWCRSKRFWVVVLEPLQPTT